MNKIKNVVLYSTGCPKCEILKKKLAEHGILYDENSSVEEMLTLGITQVPMLLVNGILMSFQEAVKWLNERK
ncbi:MAG: hypothetical protein J6Y20_11510 [Lachnospiraceae bacterium]|nr:hypothetical protein [Lachnospiraceae bacterium]